MTRPLAALLLLVPLPDLSAQLNHDMPPPINVVGAGFNLDYSAKSKQAAWYTILGGGALTAILATAEGTRGTAAPWVAGGLTMGVGVSLNLHGLRWERRAAALWKCGYSPHTLYEMVPDSLGDNPPREFRIPRMIENTPIHLPARMR
jgi:hypothetical protein